MNKAVEDEIPVSSGVSDIGWDGEGASPIPTPFYLIDESKLVENLEKIAAVREHCGAKSLLALKAFSTWSVFPIMSRYMDGTTSSSLNEARLGHEKFGKETHAFSVAYPDEEIEEIAKFADKVIFNSVSQLERHSGCLKGIPLGLRANPGISYSHFDLADPARKYSRLGVADLNEIERVSPLISGLMFHYNCENDDFANFASSLDFISEKYSSLLHKMNWVSLGGGIFFTKDSYPLEEFCKKLKSFSEEFSLQIYLEPGEAALSSSTELVVKVIDIVRNVRDIAIVDASVEAHMLDHLIYRTNPRLSFPPPGSRQYIVAGRTCLAGDIFGDFHVDRELKPGDIIRIADAGAYTMVKRNWFNGVPAPAVAIRKSDSSIMLARRFTYEDFVSNLS